MEHSSNLSENTQVGLLAVFHLLYHCIMNRKALIIRATLWKTITKTGQSLVQTLEVFAGR